MKYKNKKIQISCDGGAATGKSTGAKMLSKRYNLKFLSSGLLYRYASFLLIKHNPKDKFKLGTWQILLCYVILDILYYDSSGQIKYTYIQEIH